MTDHHIAETPSPTDPELTAGMSPATAWRAGGILAILVVTLAALFPAAYAWQDWMTAVGIVDAYDAVKGAFESLRGR
jgi:hypothetical protein